MRARNGGGAGGGGVSVASSVADVYNLERAKGEAGQAELRLDHLPLLGDPEASVHRSGRLRLDGEVRRSAARPTLPPRPWNSVSSTPRA